MSSDKDDAWIGELLAHRQVVPRWHPPDLATASGERDGQRKEKPKAAVPLKWVTLLQEQVDRGDAHALVELNEVEFILGRTPESKGSGGQMGKVRAAWTQAANLRLVPAPPTRVDGVIDIADDARARIRAIRESLRSKPDQALLWSELSRNHLILGSDQAADKAMQCAIQLASRSTYLRRSAARLYLHLRQPDRALALVRHSPGIQQDPRMLAAEVALSDSGGGKSNWGRTARDALSNGKYRPEVLSELAAALATVEMSHGKHKNARRLFSESMVSPTENSLAQAQWASERDSRIVIPPEAWQTPFSYEAQAMAARLKRDWDSVLDASERWLADEPYSMRPAGMGSFASFSVEQYRRSERLASAGLESNPDSRLLLNNRCVSRAYLGDLEGAFADLKSALRVRKAEDPVLIATLGLVAYRSGRPDLGSRCYSSAITGFAEAKNKLSLALAALYWIREEIVLGSADAGIQLEFIRKNLPRITGGKQEPELESMLEAVEAELVGRRPLIALRQAPAGDAHELDSLYLGFAKEAGDSIDSEMRRTLT